MTSTNDGVGQSACTRLYIEVRRAEDGPVLLRKDVDDAELWDLRAEAWQTLILRRGQPDIALEDVRFDLQANYECGDAGRLTGITLETAGVGGQRLRYKFTIHAFDHIAAGASRELIHSGALQPCDEPYYELFAETVSQQSPDVNDGIAITTSSAKLEYVRFPIRRLWQHAKRIGPEGEQLSPVFYTHDALSRAEMFARRGGNQQPPIETGCILVGTLCSCPETGEFYVVVRDALEAKDAASKEFSLEYSDRDWTRMLAILRARQSRPEGRADRFAGQGHGHPFLPANGAAPCELCAGKPEVKCARTSCFVSLADSDWSRAIFGRQPWQLCHIFGLNARAEHVDKLFGLRNGQLLERGFAVVPEFVPDEPSVNDPLQIADVQAAATS
jgi:hypothetical protein